MKWRLFLLLARSVFSGDEVVIEHEGDFGEEIPYRRRDDGSIDVDATVEDVRQQLTRDYEQPEISRLLSRRRRRKMVELMVQQNRQLLEDAIARGDLR